MYLKRAPSALMSTALLKSEGGGLTEVDPPSRNHRNGVNYGIASIPYYSILTALQVE